MVNDFKDIIEISKNRFAESNLGKQSVSNYIHDSGKDLDKSLADISKEKNSSYKDVFLEGDHYEVNHMPTDSVSSLDQNDANRPISQNIEPPVYDTNGKNFDDNGKSYKTEDGKLIPASTYELNGSVYTTDDKGRIIHCEANPQLSPENPRDNDAQRQAGGNDRKPNDQGGHIIGRDLNGDGGGGNLVAMDSKINQSDYKRMENDIKNDLTDGKNVTLTTDIAYNGDSKRPDKITVAVTADGKGTVYKFDNNLDGSLMGEVPENGKDAVQAELDDIGGGISSIKEEYDENGNLLKPTVNITYTDEDGTTHRTKVVIDNPQGGE